MKIKGIILILISAFMFGTYGLWSRLMGPFFDNFFQSSVRGLILAIILIPILLYKKQLIPIHKKDRKWMTVFIIFTAGTQAPIYYAFNHMDVGSATLLFFTTLLIMMYITGIGFLGEKITKVKIVSMILALLGLYLVFQFSVIAFSILAALMAILNGIASGGELGFSKKLSGNYSPLYLSWISWVAVLVFSLPISIALRETWVMPTISLPWIYLLMYTIVSLLAFWAAMEGLKYIEASIGGLIGLLEIIFSIMFGIIIFKESLTPQILIGGVLIIIAAAMPNIQDLVKKKKSM
jgi:drug/metabolite transporter (DMT)-like permease